MIKGGVSQDCSAAGGNMKFAILLLAFSVAICFAQQPTPCKNTPIRWEAKVLQSNATHVAFLKMYYDGSDERVTLRDERLNTTYIFIHKENVYYEYSGKTNTCKTGTIDRPFRSIYLPDNAEYVDTIVIGTNAIEKYGLAVNVWRLQHVYYGTIITEYVADDGDGDESCLPISYTEIGRNGPPRKIDYHHQSYYDIELGVNNDRFIPPRACTQP